MTSDAHPLLELIRRRATVERFDSRRSLSDEQIRQLVADATAAPSSFNIQHWRFVAVRHPEGKRRLQRAAHGQAQVAEAAVTFIVLGDLDGVGRLPMILEQSVAAGVLPEGKAEAWIRMAGEIYGDPQIARDEALRSASLAAMTMMLAAEARGLATGALSGFDAAQVRREFAIAERYLPVMLLAVGHPIDGDEVHRQPRLPVDEVLAFDDGRDL